MLWYLADGSLNDYLKSQVELQGQYYSGQQTKVAQATFVSHTGLLTLEQLTLANLKREKSKSVIIIDKVSVQLAPVQPSSNAQKSNDISKRVQHITVDKVTINKLRFNLLASAEKNKLNNLMQLQQKISLKLAADFPVLYPDIAAKIYAQQHPELNAGSVENTAEGFIQSKVIENNQAALQAKAAKQKKRVLGKATTRITILAFTIESLEINTIHEDGSNLVRRFNNIELPVIGKEHGLASKQLGGEIIRLLLDTASQLPQKNTQHN